MNIIPISNEIELNRNKESNMDSTREFMFFQKNFKKDQIY